MNTFIGIAKGALGKFIEAYLRYLGTDVDMGGPLTQVKDLPGGRATFRIQRSRDVPRWIGSGYDFGITGNDVTWDEMCAGNDKIWMRGGLDYEAEMLGFPGILGKLALLGSGDLKAKKDRLKVVVRDYYTNIARRDLEKFDGLKPSDYDLTIVRGSTEGYLSGDGYDLAIETVFSEKTLAKENIELERMGKPKIEIIREMLPISPLVISDGKYTRGDFSDLFE